MDSAWEQTKGLFLGLSLVFIFQSHFHRHRTTFAKHLLQSRLALLLELTLLELKLIGLLFISPILTTILRSSLGEIILSSVTYLLTFLDNASSLSHILIWFGFISSAFLVYGLNFYLNYCSRRLEKEQRIIRGEKNL